jgi:hypothetical protein
MNLREVRSDRGLLLSILCRPGEAVGWTADMCGSMPLPLPPVHTANEMGFSRYRPSLRPGHMAGSRRGRFKQETFSWP